MLLDLEMEHLYCLENSTQHQLAWVIALVCGCRPGSLGKMTGYDEYMTWGDWEFLRTTDSIYVKLNLSLLKGFMSATRSV